MCLPPPPRNFPTLRLKNFFSFHSRPPLFFTHMLPASPPPVVAAATCSSSLRSSRRCHLLSRSLVRSCRLSSFSSSLITILQIQGLKKSIKIRVAKCIQGAFRVSVESDERDHCPSAMLSRVNVMQCWLFNVARVRGFIHGHQQGFMCQQKFSLVNVKLKWVNDRALDSVVTSYRGLKAAETLVSIISSSGCLPIYHLSRYRGQLGLPHDLKLSTFIRSYPNIFIESYIFDSGGSRVPCFSLSPGALKVHQEKVNIFQQNQLEFRDRLCKLLMLTKDRILPLQTIDQLKWDLGLPYDYQHSFVPNHPERFSFVRLPDDRIGLKLLYWDDSLAVSELQKSASIQQKEDDIRKGSFAFPIGFTRGFGLRRKCMEWLNEWQTLPYTSPYLEASHLDPRTDVSEKRIVGVFHELLHLTVLKKTERKNFSNLRKCLGLPQKFTKVFERHPGIFYISKKGDTQTIILKEAYNGPELVRKHPLVMIREELASMLKKGLLDRSRGLFKRDAVANLEEYGRKDFQ